MMERSFPSMLIFAGILLCFIGFIIVFLASFTPITEASGNVSAAGVIFIGPFPIVFGAGEYGMQLIWLSIIIVALMIIASYIFIKGSRGFREEEQSSV